MKKHHTRPKKKRSIWVMVGIAGLVYGAYAYFTKKWPFAKQTSGGTTPPTSGNIDVGQPNEDNPLQQYVDSLYQ